MSAQEQSLGDPDPPPVRSRATGPVLSVVARPAPVARLGLAWAAVLLIATALGPVATVLLVAPVAAVAAASAIGLRRSPQHPLTPSARIWAGAGAAVVALAAVGGPVAALVALVVVAVVVPRVVHTPGVAGALVVVAPAAAAASLVVAASERGIFALALASAVCLWDLAVYAMGTGATGGVAGLVAGAVSLAVLAVLFAAIADPPLSGSRPWVLFAVVIVAAPLGVALGARLQGRRRLPALRRLDSLMVAGPLWTVAVRVVVHH